MKKCMKHNLRHAQTTKLGQSLSSLCLKKLWMSTFLDLYISSQEQLETIYEFIITLHQGVKDFHLLVPIHFLLGIAWKNARSATLVVPKPPKLGRVCHHSPSRGDGFPPSWTYTFPPRNCMKKCIKHNLGMPEPPNLGSVYCHSTSRRDGFPPSWTCTFPYGNSIKICLKHNPRHAQTT